jgi:ABC-type uncharacterized transport system substrate-binding protein
VIRRAFLKILSGAVSLASFPTRAQQGAIPVVAYLSSGVSISGREQQIDGLRRGLSQMGFHDEKTVHLEFEWAGDNYDQLPRLATKLAERRIAVIVCPQLASALAAKSATSKIPIVFLVGDDPVKRGLASSINHPGENATGMSMLAVGLVAKRLGLMRDLVPSLAVLAVLVNPANPNSSSEIKEIEEAGRAMKQRIELFYARTEEEVQAAFDSLAGAGAGAVVVGPDPFFNSRRVQIVGLAAEHRIPGIYEWREFVEEGGLASYGPNLGEAMRQVGIYVGRILKGEKPSDLPVVQPTKFEFVINLKTANALGLAVPPVLLAQADEVIE